MNWTVSVKHCLFFIYSNFTIKFFNFFRPVFTISIGDMHVDEKDDVTWTCEAFGIPDVRYEWMKNGKPLIANSSKMAIEDRDRYEIRDNVLIIRSVSYCIE